MLLAAGMEVDWSAFHSLSPLQWWWVAQIVLVGTSLLGLVAQGSSIQLKTDPPAIGQDDVKPRFYHFRKRISTYYLLGLLSTLWVAWNLYKIWCQGSHSDSRLPTILEYIATPKKQSVDVTCVFVALAFYILHLLRRLYESLSISIFSMRQLLSPLDLFWSVSFYLLIGVALVADGPDLTVVEPCFSIGNLSWYHGIGIGLFVWASIHHNTCHKILALLRRNRAGHIVTTGYKVPKGDWFEYVSCPHHLAEILIYISIGFLLGMRSVTWWWATAYVFANQLFLAYNLHVWYRRKFELYPASRKMLIPFVM